VRKELAYLVEEEKLAGDVYDLAHSLYGSRVFASIGRAEDTHAAAVRVLLSRYGVADPTAGRAAGSFVDPSLRTLYAKLAAQVRSGRAAAIAAGIAIERADIKDLKALLAADLPADVEQVAGNLLAGSRKHLAALKRQR
jgi:hypothetical protein